VRRNEVRRDVDNIAEIRPQISLRPIANPSVLGLYALGSSAFVFGAYLADWYGSDGSPLFLFSFLALFGGLGQLLAGMWAFRARDTLAVTVFTLVGLFWLAYGLMQLTVLLVDEPIAATGTTEFGYWLIPLTVVLWVAAVASFRRAMLAGVALGALALGATFLALGQLADNDVLARIAGWVWVIAGLLAWFVASARLLNETAYREHTMATGEPDETVVERDYREPGVVYGDWLGVDLGRRRTLRDEDEPQARWEFQWPFRRKIG
jgi:succinate-acetate transporter protein